MSVSHPDVSESKLSGLQTSRKMLPTHFNNTFHLLVIVKVVEVLKICDLGPRPSSTRSARH